MIEISATLNNAGEFEKVLLAAAEEYGPRNACLLYTSPSPRD